MLHLEVGKIYLTRDRVRVKIIKYVPKDNYPYKASNGNSYLESGYKWPARISLSDLICEDTTNEEANLINTPYTTEEAYKQNTEKFTDSFVKDSQIVPKIQPSLVEPEYILGTARVLNFGANKYGRENWKKCLDIQLYKDALLRHTLAYLGGELVDSDTNELHLYHMSCNLMFLSWFENNLVKYDINPKC